MSDNKKHFSQKIIMKAKFYTLFSSSCPIVFFVLVSPMKQTESDHAET
jgi:hypothetical protein